MIDVSIETLAFRFGLVECPDAEEVDAPDSSVDPRRADAFSAAIRAYWPDLPDGSLQRDTPASVRRSRCPANASRISSSKGQNSMRLPGSCSCSASRAAA